MKAARGAVHGAARLIATGEGRLIATGEGRARVEGVLDFDTVGDLLIAGAAQLRRPGPLQIDLGGVGGANSAGLALLLEWMDLARSRQVALTFVNLPDSLRRIAACSNLEALLPTTEIREYGGT